MLNINPDTVCFIIAKAREFQAKEGVILPEPMDDSPADNWAVQVLSNHADDHTMQEVSSAIDDLDDEAQTELVALMWLGRGDYLLAEWEETLQAVIEARSDHPAEYLMAHPQLPFYLEEGLSAHGYSCD